MYSEERFREIEAEFLEKTTNYDSDHSNGAKARTLFITAVELARLQNHVQEQYFDEIDERHQYQDIFHAKGLNAVFALYWLLKHRYFDAGYREVRYLFESYLVIKGLNRDQAEAARILEYHLDEIRNLPTDMDQVERAMYGYESVEDLHDILADEKDRLREEDSVYGDIYNFLSNRSTHPVRIEGAMLDGTDDTGEEEHLLDWGIILVFGLARQFLKTYMDTSARDAIIEFNQPIVNQFDQVMDTGVPEFLTDPY